MDTLRGNFGALADSDDYDTSDEDLGEDLGRDTPPAAIGQDERRMQVRAYNHWASLLQENNFPAIEDLEPANLPDFGPYSVLLDFTAGIENPGITYLGDKLAVECDAPAGEMRMLADVPSRSLLSRITDHYMQILANQAPIGFEAEFINQRNQTILYRGILLPFSSDDDTIDFIYGVINWKELADSRAADELLLEIDQALEPQARVDTDEPMTDWADGPGAIAASDADPLPAGDEEIEDENAFDLAAFYASHSGNDDDEGEDDAEDGDDIALPRPSFGLNSVTDVVEDASDEDDTPLYGSLLKTPLRMRAPLQMPQDGDFAAAEPDDGYYTPSESAELTLYQSEAPSLTILQPDDMGLADWLADARELANAARSSEDRTRSALYDAIGRAYDFSLAAADAPEEFGELLSDAGLTMQDRAPMTPVVKLVFGADYDKTRVTEYAAALSLAHRLELPRGGLGAYLMAADGGLKGVVQAERRLRREETGRLAIAEDPALVLARKLRALAPQDFAALASDGAEFALVLIRRSDDGSVAMLGEVPDDAALVEKAARRLIG